jgi:vancomycin resistance protein YoaR
MEKYTDPVERAYNEGRGSVYAEEVGMHKKTPPKKVNSETWIQKLKRKIKEYFTGQRKTQSDAQLQRQGYSQRDIDRLKNRDREQAQQRELMNQMGK